MKRALPFVLALLCTLASRWQAVAQQAPAKRWDYRFGSSEYDDCQQVVAMPNGDFVIVGHSRAPVGGDVTQPAAPSNPTSRDFWVVRTNANGTKLWDHRYGGLFDTFAVGAFATPDGGILLAGHVQGGIGRDVTQPIRTFSSATSDYWVVKIDANGTKLWDRCFGGSDNEYLRTAAPTRDGGLVLVGVTFSPVSGEVSQPSRGGVDGWVVRLDAAGTLLWDRRLGSNQDDRMYGVTETADGGVAVLGFAGAGVSGDVTAAPRSPNRADGWLVKLARNGTIQWNRRYGTPDGVSGGGMLVQTSNRGYALTMNTLTIGSTPAIGIDKTQPNIGGYDGWLVQTDSVGTPQWDRVYGGPDDDGLNRLLPMPNGGFLLGGTTGPNISGSLPGRGQADGWLVRTDAAGTLLWQRTVGGLSDDILVGLARCLDGGVAVALVSDSGVGGDRTQTSRGLADYWLVRLNAEVLSASRPAWAGTLALYPNPSAGPCQLALPARVGTATSAQVRVFDALGRRVWEGTLPLLSRPSTAALPLPALAAGVYGVHVGIADQSATLRLSAAP